METEYTIIKKLLHILTPGMNILRLFKMTLNKQFTIGIALFNMKIQSIFYTDTVL